MSSRTDRVDTTKRAGAREKGADARAYADVLSKLAYFGLFISFALAATALSIERSRFTHAYFVATGFLTTIGLGGLFFVLLHHLVKARWSVLACRQMQWVANLLPACMILFLPNLLWAREIFPWMSSSGAAHLTEADHIGYLNAAGFFVRTAVYFMVWTGLVWAYKNKRSEIEGSPESERRLLRCRRMSGPAMVLFGVTTTFASFDWFMSLQPNWHSAIFGVYIFAGAVTAALSVLALFTIQLERLGVVRESTNVSTRHDIGKLLFGFTLFWAYIAFSQYLLIWYAGMRTEIAFFDLRLSDPWRPLTLWLVALQFVVPFAVLISASAKRSPLVLFLTSLVIIVAHALDISWLVIPALENGHSHWGLADIAPAVLAISLLLLVLAQGIRSESQLPQQTQEHANLEPLATL
jgi:hypothetical protein